MSTDEPTADDVTADDPAVDDAATDAPDDEPILSLDDVNVHYTPGGVVKRALTDKKVRAVDGVSFDLYDNDIVVLVGESGCGKTTLGKTAIGLEKPTNGSISYRGQDIWDAKDNPRDADIEFTEIRRAMQIIHQDPANALNSSRRVKAILSDPLKKYRTELGPKEREDTIYRFLEFVDMMPPEDYAERYPHQLSGGEKQRIALGRALLMNPDVILADEAISALDVSLRVGMMDLILDLQETFDTSYIFISHDLANARYLAKRAGGRIAIMYLGEIVEIGPPEEILQNPTHPYTKVLKWSTPTVDPDLAKQRIQEDPPVREVDVPDPEDPPSGCKFHTRCPEAREVCTQEEPGMFDTAGESETACFRALETHEYWNSAELADAEEVEYDAQDSSTFGD
ncbi:ABC transporter ATP-binding protein [Halosimplex pelagicum]|uniref:ABC transporter ATP-binding protein n=1 Tax=Halosimplex pelagicum TaxID=869886 RepID=A0A7D5T6X7_9EURY|nr:ABC transporter ATP-binding protein [Halosimplex pelagicum]QLH83648.1 ABC transporter ATP-binding protein [Halosimplex pelagicum]